MAAPLSGIRVLDLSAVVSGPICTQTLADQGAEVIKVEPPAVGDIVRWAGEIRGGMSATFAILNRGKRSVVLNLREERGRELLRDLAAQCDVVVQNFRPGVVDRMGIGYEAMRARNPELIYVSISGFGPDGPYAQKRVYDPIIQALSGMATVQADPDTRAPDLVRNIVCDKVTGLTAAQAITSALFARERGAGGQHLELAMLDAAVSFLWSDGMGRDIFLDGDRYAGAVLADFYRVTRTADGFMTWFTASDQEFAGLARVLGHPEWADDPRYATLAGRVDNFVELAKVIEEKFASRTTDDLHRALEEADVPCARINTVEGVAGDPQVVHNELLFDSDHPHAGRLRQPRVPTRFSGTPPTLERPAPQLGEHTAEVLAELGLSADETERLRESGIIG